MRIEAGIRISGLAVGAFTLLLCIVLFAAGNAHAQPAGELDVTVAETSVTGFPEVSLLLAVADSGGAPLSGLTADQFAVVEAGISVARPILALATQGEREELQYRLTYYSGHDCDGEVHTLVVTVDAPAGTGSAVADIGPLVNNPGCNVLTPTPTETPLPPTPTATATATATVTPSPSATATATASATPVIVASVTPPAGSPPAEGNRPQAGDIPPWGWVAGAGVLLAAGGVVYWYIAHGSRCSVCKGRLSPGEKVCPYCGAPRL